jgi:hypothetical protein
MVPRRAAGSERMTTGDITTLANAHVVEKVELVQGKEPVKLQEEPEGLKQFGTVE